MMPVSSWLKQTRGPSNNNMNVFTKQLQSMRSSFESYTFSPLFALARKSSSPFPSFTPVGCVVFVVVVVVVVVVASEAASRGRWALFSPSFLPKSPTKKPSRSAPQRDKTETTTVRKSTPTRFFRFFFRKNSNTLRKLSAKIAHGRFRSEN